MHTSHIRKTSCLCELCQPRNPFLEWPNVRFVVIFRVIINFVLVLFQSSSWGFAVLSAIPGLKLGQGLPSSIFSVCALTCILLVWRQTLARHRFRLGPWIHYGLEWLAFDATKAPIVGWMPILRFDPLFIWTSWNLRMESCSTVRLIMPLMAIYIRAHNSW